MHIPIKVDYGVRALVDLAMDTTDSPVRAADIARRTAIPEQFLAQVLHTLSRSGFVKSQRGPTGGHSLAIEATEIRLSEVVVALGGPDTPVGCLDDTNMCIHVPACAQREVWRSVADAVFKILNSTTIADLADRTRVVTSAVGGNSPSEPVDFVVA